MVIYSCIADGGGGDDLTFMLRRSVELVEERKQMSKAKSKKNGNKERASMSRERRIALALRAVLDQGGNHDSADDSAEGTAEVDAQATLDDLGYGSLIGIPKRLKDLNEQLKVATDTGDFATIARIGAEMVKVQSGKSPKTAAVSAAKPLSRKSAGTKSIQNTAVDGANVSGASAGGAGDTQ